MTIKHYGLLALAIFCTTQASAWYANFINDTDGEIVVQVIYSAPGICAAERKIIARGSFDTFETSICCTDAVEVTATSGKAKGDTYRFSPPRAGLGMTCANYRVHIKTTQEGKLTAEAALY
jgi:hypothetical protein